MFNRIELRVRASYQTKILLINKEQELQLEKIKYRARAFYSTFITLARKGEEEFLGLLLKRLVWRTFT